MADIRNSAPSADHHPVGRRPGHRGLTGVGRVAGHRALRDNGRGMVRMARRPARDRCSDGSDGNGCPHHGSRAGGCDARRGGHRDPCCGRRGGDRHRGRRDDGHPSLGARRSWGELARPRRCRGTRPQPRPAHVGGGRAGRTGGRRPERTGGPQKLPPSTPRAQPPHSRPSADLLPVARAWSPASPCPPPPWSPAWSEPRPRWPRRPQPRRRPVSPPAPPPRPSTSWPWTSTSP